MKHLIPTSIAATCIFAASLASADTAHRAKIKKLDYEFIDTPRFETIDNPERAQERSGVQWLEIEAEVEVETLHDSRFIPKLIASWHVIVQEPDFDNQNQGKAQMVRLTGEFTFLDIRTRDRRTYLVAYIHPDSLARITGDERPNKQDIVGVALTLAGPNLTTTGKYARDLEKSTYKPELKWWSNWDRKTYKDLVVAKHRTPFAPLWTDRHPAVQR